MGIKIIDDACSIAGNQGIVTVEGADPGIVSSTAAKQEVLTKAATMGLTRAGISGQGGAYPVDADGKEIGNMDDEHSVITYRNDFQVTSGI